MKSTLVDIDVEMTARTESADLQPTVTGDWLNDVIGLLEGFAEHKFDVSRNFSGPHPADELEATTEAGIVLAYQEDAKELLRKVTGSPQHPDDNAVDRFAAAMKAKMAEARAKGRSGWDDPESCTVEFLAALLLGHIGKGNPGNFEDIANLCMMLHQRGADPSCLTEQTGNPVAEVVKPLEWDERRCEGGVVNYRIHIGYGLMKGAFALTCNGSTIGEYSSETEAKDAAQADYERRILSALTPTAQPDPVREAARVLLREWDEHGEGLHGELSTYSESEVGIELCPDLDGEWVKIEDVTAALRALAAKGGE